MFQCSSWILPYWGPFLFRTGAAGGGLGGTIRNPKVLSPVFADPWSKKMRSPNCSAQSPLTRDLSGLGVLSCRMRMSSPRAGREI